MSADHIAYVALGSNLGQRAQNLGKAVGSLTALDGCRIVAESRAGNYPAQGGPPGQPDYLNMAVCLETQLDPFELLEQMQSIERSMGRPAAPQRQPWVERTVDLDLLLFDEIVIVTPDLVVPHPRMHRRRFVLEPLAQIAAEAQHPVLGITIGELLERLAHEREG